MDPGCFTLPKVSYIYPLFTEQLTCNTEKHKIIAKPNEQKHTQKKENREKNSQLSVFQGCQHWDKWEPFCHNELFSVRILCPLIRALSSCHCQHCCTCMTAVWIQLLLDNTISNWNNHLELRFIMIYHYHTCTCVLSVSTTLPAPALMETINGLCGISASNFQSNKKFVFHNLDLDLEIN